MKGAGCRTCNGTGYKGRVALYEVMRFTDSLKEMVLQGASTAELKAGGDQERHEHAAHERHQEGPRRRHDARRDHARHDVRLSDERERSSSDDEAPMTQPKAQSQPASAPARHDREGRERPAHHDGLAAAPPHRRQHRPAASCRRSAPVETKQLCYSVLTEEQKSPVREEQRARSLLRREEPLALPRQHLHAARRRRRRVPRDPVQDPDLRRARAAADRGGARAASRAGSSSSPGRRAPARARRSRRSSTRSTPSSACTS